MFAHAITSTSATTTRRATSGRSKRSRSVDVPAPAGSSTNGSRRKADWNCTGSEPARTCGCTARSAAVADSSDMPGFTRSMMFSHDALSSSSTSARIGRIRSKARPTSMPRNPGGVTPTIGTAERPSVMGAPIPLDAPPNRSCHSL